MTKPTPSERFLELLGTTSKNFLGSGLTMSEFLQLHDAEKIAASWSLQSREEKRLGAAMGHVSRTTPAGAPRREQRSIMKGSHVEGR